MRKILLYIMTEKGYRVLDYVLTHYPHSIAGVVSARDNAIENDYFDGINNLCSENTIPTFDRLRVPNELQDKCLALAVSWRWMICASNLIVFHDSLLPRYRGFNPLVTALINGDEEIGVTALLASDEYDRGDIVAQEKIRVGYPLKIQQAIKQIVKCYILLVATVIDQAIRGLNITGTKQDEKKVSYSLWRDENDYVINWFWPASRIRRFVDAVGYPYKGACTAGGGVLYRIHDAREIQDVKIENRCPGKVIFLKNGLPTVVCGEGLLEIQNMTIDQLGDQSIPFSKFRTRFQ